MIHDESIDALPTIECDYAEIKMAGGHNTNQSFPLSMSHQLDTLEETDVDRKKGGGWGFCCKMDG